MGKVNRSRNRNRGIANGRPSQPLKDVSSGNFTILQAVIVLLSQFMINRSEINVLSFDMEILHIWSLFAPKFIFWQRSKAAASSSGKVKGCLDSQKTQEENFYHKLYNYKI